MIDNIIFAFISDHRQMKTYAIFAEMEQEPRYYVEAKDIDDLVKIMKKRNKEGKPDGMFPGWCPVEINKENL